MSKLIWKLGHTFSRILIQMASYFVVKKRDISNPHPPQKWVIYQLIAIIFEILGHITIHN